MRKIGLHLRLETTLVDLLQRALKLNVDFFQCFLTLKTAGRLLPLNNNDIKEFINLRRQFFKELYLHISYWVNLSAIEYNPHRLLKKELALAKKLEFTHIIFHPGSAKGTKDIAIGVDALARMLNALLQKEPEFTFVLENVAQKFPSMGGNIGHFKRLLEKLDKPERINFCIDTAHAFSHGYDFSSKEKLDLFVNYIDQNLGLDKVCLIHLNDNAEERGTHIDRHAKLGEGKIGLENLKRFVRHPKLQHINILTEAPAMSKQDLKLEFKKLINWNKKEAA